MSMTFRGIDGTNDWSFGSGVQSYFTGAAAVSANIRTRLLTFLGECFFSLQSGVDWLNLLGGKNPAAQAGIVVQCRTIVANSFGVVKINSITPVLDARRKLTLSFNVDTIFSRNVSGSVVVTA